MKRCICGKMGFVITLIVFSLCLISPISGAQAADNIIKIGVIGPMKFIAGEQPWKGAQMAAEAINAAGGVKVKGVPHKIELVQADDNCLASVADASNAMERLITVNKVNFVTGGFRTEAVTAQQEIAANYKTIFMGNGGGLTPSLAERVATNYDRYKYYFMGWIPSDIFGVIMLTGAEGPLRAIQSQLGIKQPKVALLLDKAAWTEPILKKAEEVFPKMGAEIVGVWRPGFSASSVVAEMSAIKTAGAHLIFAVNAGPAGNPTSVSWGELKVPAAIAGCNLEAMMPRHWESTKGLCEYSETTTIWARAKITEKTIPFFDAYLKRYGEDPNYFAGVGHDNIYIFKEAIENAGTIESDAVVAALEKTNYIGTTGRIEYTPRGSRLPHTVIWGPKHVPYLCSQWRNGKIMAVWPDGNEVGPALQAIGAPSGWKGVKYEGTVKYELPPWMVEYWKSKK